MSLLKTGESSNYHKFGQNDFIKFENEHKRISKALGIISFDGMSTPEKLLGKSPIDMFEKFLFGKIGAERTNGGKEEKIQLDDQLESG